MLSLGRLHIVPSACRGLNYRNMPSGFTSYRDSKCGLGYFLHQGLLEALGIQSLLDLLQDSALEKFAVGPLSDCGGGLGVQARVHPKGLKYQDIGYEGFL